MSDLEQRQAGVPALGDEEIADDADDQHRQPDRHAQEDQQQQDRKGPEAELDIAHQKSPGSGLMRLGEMALVNERTTQ